MSAGAPQTIESRGLTRQFSNVPANAGVNLRAEPLRRWKPIATFET
jgi:hypothetical protein